MVASRAQRSNRGPRVRRLGCASIYVGRALCGSCVVWVVRAVCGCWSAPSVCSMANRCWQMRCAAFVCWGEPSTVRRICFDNLRAARRCASTCGALAAARPFRPSIRPSIRSLVRSLVRRRDAGSSGSWSNNGSVSAAIAGIPRRVRSNIIELLYIYTIVSPGAELNSKRPSWASIRIVVFGW